MPARKRRALKTGWRGGGERGCCIFMKSRGVVVICCHGSHVCAGDGRSGTAGCEKRGERLCHHVIMSGRNVNIYIVHFDLFCTHPDRLN